MALTGFMVEGWRIAVTDDVWAAWSPVGNLFARASDPFMSDAAMQTGHVVIWWFHLAVAFGFIAWVPFSKMSHVVTAPLNIFTANLDGYGGSLKAIDFETAERFGINHLGDFTWKDLLDFDACTECGRCTDVCPANAVGKSLSPRDIILDLQTLMHERGDSLLANGNGQWERRRRTAADHRRQDSGLPPRRCSPAPPAPPAWRPARSTSSICPRSSTPGATWSWKRPTSRKG